MGPQTAVPAAAAATGGGRKKGTKLIKSDHIKKEGVATKKPRT